MALQKTVSSQAGRRGFESVSRFKTLAESVCCSISLLSEVGVTLQDSIGPVWVLVQVCNDLSEAVQGAHIVKTPPEVLLARS